MRDARQLMSLKQHTVVKDAKRNKVPFATLAAKAQNEVSLEKLASSEADL